MEEGLYADNNNQWQRDSALRYSFTLQIISHMYSSTLIFSPVVCAYVWFFSLFTFFLLDFFFVIFPSIQSLYLFFNAMHFVSFYFLCIEIQTYGQCILLFQSNLYFMFRKILFSSSCVCFFLLVKMEWVREFSEVRNLISKKLALDKNALAVHTIN